MSELRAEPEPPRVRVDGCRVLIDFTDPVLAATYAKWAKAGNGWPAFGDYLDSLPAHRREAMGLVP